MNEVDDFIYNFDGKTKQIMLRLHELMMENPGVTSKIRYKIPFYYRKSWICYLNPLKNGDVEFAFTRANELSNASGLLNFKNRTQVAGITFSHAEEISDEGIREIIQEALLLDETIPYSAKNKSGSQFD